jgi:hypothetical protein
MGDENEDSGEGMQNYPVMDKSKTRKVIPQDVKTGINKGLV